MINRYLHWTFRSGFFSVIVSDFIAFFLLCLFWACGIYALALVEPKCFIVAGNSLLDLDEANGDQSMLQDFFFADAFQLSWTTFSTVVRELNERMHD